MRKTIIITVLFVTAMAVLLASESIFQSFAANSGSNAVTLEWRTNTESGIAKFEVERSSQGVPFSKIAEESAKGFPSQYKYVDSDAMMKSSDVELSKLQESTLSQNSYTYRLKAVYSNGSAVYSDEINVKHTINSIRRTWGMIKEMFR